ncbi:hypothetical protein AB0D33_15240 [Streptomyces sp. NPDC048404]|uniref:hypothetical protein n=1 Tax=unclassified Streptomyces TaxID=2593676 RepID=UPI00341FC90C
MDVMQVSAHHLERSRAKHNPEIDHEAAQVAAALSLRVAPVTDLVIRLRAAASKTEPDYVVTDDGRRSTHRSASTWSLATAAGAELDVRGVRAVRQRVRLRRRRRGAGRG